MLCSFCLQTLVHPYSLISPIAHIKSTPTQPYQPIATIQSHHSALVSDESNKSNVLVESLVARILYFAHPFSEPLQLPQPQSLYCLRCSVKLRMLKQSSSRNLKVKGFSRVKLALQIGLLLAICIWLVYQAKQFSYHTAALVEEGSKEEVLGGGAREYQMLKLGRKNLNPRLGDLATDFEKVEDEEVEISEDEESKLRENEEDESAVGNDDASISNQEKTEEGGEHEQLEDLIDEDDSEE